MLKKIEQLNQEIAAHCGDPSIHLPTLLRTIALSPSSNHLISLINIQTAIYNEQTVCKAAQYVVPLLIEMLKNDSMANKDFIMREMLTPLSVHGTDDTALNNYRIGNLSDAAIWTETAYKNVLKGLDTYLALLNDSDSSVRSAASLLLSTLSLYAAQVGPHLQSQMESEQDTIAKASLIRNLGTLIANSPDASQELKLAFTNFCETQLEITAHPFIKLNSALSLIRVAQNTAPPSAIKMLIESVKKADSYAGFKWSSFDVVYFCGSALQYLSLSEAIICLKEIIETNQNPLNNYQIVELAIKVAFENRLFQQVTFTDFQRLILTKIVQNDIFWQDKSIEMILRDFQLPSSHDELKFLLSIT